MSTFSEWLVFDDIRESVYEKSVRRLHVMEALRKTLEFYNNSVLGNWGFILEESREEGTSAKSDPDKTISRAKKIQRLARMVRWAAMLDRRDAVAEVKRIYEKDWLPHFRHDEWTQVHESKEDWKYPDFDDDDEETADVVEPEITDPKNHLYSILEPTIEKLTPLLVMLGYLKDGDMDYGTKGEKIELIGRAAEYASLETGNDPPKDDPDVKRMISDPARRKMAADDMMTELFSMLEKTARSTYMKMRRKHGFEGGEEKYGSEMDEGSILTTGLEINMKKLQSRHVNQNGTAQPWNEDLTVISKEIGNEEEAKHVINSIKSPISNSDRATRDERRQERKAAGLAPSSGSVFTCSDCGHTRSVENRHAGTRMKCPKCQGEGLVQRGAGVVSHDAGAKAEDGTVTGMDPVDSKSRDSLTTAAAAETNKEMMEAFREAMKELAQEDASKATLTCLWLGLHGKDHSKCVNPDAPISDEAVKEVISNLYSANLSDRKKAAEAFDKIGLNNMSPGTGWGQTGRARWEFIKLIKSKNIPPVGVFRGMPSGDIPPNWTPNYQKRHEFTPDQQSWWRWMNSVFNTLSKQCLPSIAKRMHEIMAERQTDIKPKGWQSPCSWSLSKFLKVTFSPSIRNGSIVLQGENPIRMTVYAVSKSRKTLREYVISASNQQVKVDLIDGGEEKYSQSFPLPSLAVTCPKCGGSTRGCSECEECRGRVMDRIGFLKLERDIHDILVTQKGTRAARRRR
jgi:DNA-directed RNA polymerase subunit M/transcription elongation factor TFIIS